MNPGDCPYLTDSQGQCDIDNDCPAGYKCTYQCSQGGTPSPAPYATSPPYLPGKGRTFYLLVVVVAVVCVWEEEGGGGV